jgi:DNA-binding PadR family transcriptional regulator
MGPINLNRAVVTSKVFRSMNAVAIIVYLDFLGKRQMGKIRAKEGRKKEWVILNNGEIEYTYSEALSKGITRPRFQRAIDELVEKGFIDITHSGSGGRKGDKSLYAISERWKDYGKREFVQVARPKDLRKGCGYAKYHKQQKKARNEEIQFDQASAQRKKVRLCLRENVQS